MRILHAKISVIRCIMLIIRYKMLVMRYNIPKICCNMLTMHYIIPTTRKDLSMNRMIIRKNE